MLIIVLIVSFGNKSTFGSEEEMQIYLEGVWESHTYEKTLYLVFHDGKLWDVYDAPYDLVKSAEKYKEPTYENAVASVMWEWPKYEPGKGKISQRGDYPIYIMKNGTLKQRKAVYVKSGDSVLRFESFISAFNSAWEKEHPEQKETSDSSSDKNNVQTSEYQTKEQKNETTKSFQLGTVTCSGMGASHKLYYRSGNTRHIISSCVVTGFDYEWIGNQLSLFFDIEKKEDINGTTGNSPCRFMIVIYQGGEIVYSNSMLTQGMVPGQKDNYGERVSTMLDCTKSYRVELSDYLI